MATHEVFFEGRDAVLVAIQDVTEREALERELLRQALHDPLTGLPNRALFLDRLGEEVARLGGAGRGQVDVFAVDLDDLCLVRDTLGYEAGDEVMRTIASRLADRLPVRFGVASVGREELALCVGEPTGAMAVEHAHEIQDLIAEPFVTADGVELSLSACVGVATANAKGAEAGGLLHDARLALARAKEIGPAQVALLGERPWRSTRARLGARRELQHAIEAGEISAHYQPIVSLASGAIIGAEALARWAHPARGLLMPVEFIPLAEESGLIVPLGRSLLRQACQAMSELLGQARTTSAPATPPSRTLTAFPSTS